MRICSFSTVNPDRQVARLGDYSADCRRYDSFSTVRAPISQQHFCCGTDLLEAWDMEKNEWARASIRHRSRRRANRMKGAGPVKTYRGLVMSEESDAFERMGTTNYMSKFTLALGQHGRCRFAVPDVKDG